jgi:DNA-binding response OmpR family regulator
VGEKKDAGEAARGEGSRILVVDDEEIIHVSLGRTLGRQGHQVDAVLEASLALERLSSDKYDLVITDLMMPEMDGIQLMKKMQEMALEAPVLMITGYPTIKTAIEALRLGAVDYLAKPFTRSELLGPVNRALRKTSEAAGPPVVETPGDADGVSSPEVSLLPGDRFCLRKHSWAVFRQDGTMEIGIESSFLESLDVVAGVELPSDKDLIEQGFVGFRLKTKANEEHNVFVPLSGQVVEVNHEAAQNPSDIRADTWLVRIVPSRLETELPLLLRSE